MATWLAQRWPAYCGSSKHAPLAPLSMMARRRTENREDAMIPQRTLGSALTVSALGLGCMGMSQSYGRRRRRRIDRARSIARLSSACTFFDTAEVYGPFTNEDLLGKALQGRRSEVVIATKFGLQISDGKIAGLNSQPARPSHGRGRARCGGWAPTISICSTSTASIRPCPSRRWSARWPIWSRRARCAFCGLSEAGAPDDPPRPRCPPDHGAAERVFAVGAQPGSRDSSPCCASWASAWCRSARSAAAS